MRAAFLGRCTVKSALAGVEEIIADCADLRTGENILRPLNVVGGNRNAASERFDIYQAERVGFGREDENIARGVNAGELFAELRTDEFGLRILLLEIRALRAIADDNLRARQIEIEKCLDVLLDRDTADVKPDRARVVEIALRPQVKLLEVDAAAPNADVLEAFPSSSSFSDWVATMSVDAGE